MAETDKILFAHPHVEAFPVGSVFFTAINNNPSELLGYGIWSLIGNGRTTTEDDNGEETGGSMSKTLSASNIPGHTHSIPAHNHTASCASSGSHTHLEGTTNNPSVFTTSDTDNSIGSWVTGGVDDDNTDRYKLPRTPAADTISRASSTRSAGSHSHSITITNKAAFSTGSYGSATAFDITPSYIKLFIWKRIE